MPEPVVRYTLTVTITEPLGLIDDGDVSHDEYTAQRDDLYDDMTSSAAMRAIERKVIAALSKLDGDVDCECMEAERDEE